MLQVSRREKLATTGSWMFAALLLVTCVMIFTPFAPDMPGAELDPAWMFAMNQAVGQKLALGRDIVFTYGPYVSIYSKSYHPATDHLMVLGGLYLGLCFFVAAFLTFRHSALVAKAGLVVALAVLMFSLDALIFFYPLMVGILLCTTTERRKPIGSTALTGLLMTPFGLLPLIKLSAMAACLGVMMVACVLLLGRQRWRQAVAVLAVPPLAMLLFWMLAGQPLFGLAAYLQSAGPIIGGYPEAMKWEGNPAEPLAYVICAASLGLAVWLGRLQEGRSARLAVLLLFAGILFLAFKAGFVRHDFHAAMAASLILLASLLAATLADGRAMLQAILPGVLAFVVIMAAHPPWSVGTGFDGLDSRKALTSGWAGLAQRIIAPGKLQADFDAQMSHLAAAADLPKLEGSSDIYSHNQTLLVAAGNRWNPRPVFQSYSVYTPELSEMNRQHLLGADRPDNLLFRLQPIDWRLPSLEDGASWRVMLADYQLAGARGGYLILRHRDGGHRELGQANAVATLEGRLGQALNLPPGGGLVFARLHIEQSLAGRLWSLLYKPAELRITLTTRNGEAKTFRLVAGMAQSEFLLSPLITSDGAFAALFTGQELSDLQVTTLTVEAVGWPPTWGEDYRLELTGVPSAAVAAAP